MSVKYWFSDIIYCRKDLMTLTCLWFALAGDLFENHILKLFFRKYFCSGKQRVTNLNSQKSTSLPVVSYKTNVVSYKTFLEFLLLTSVKVRTKSHGNSE